MSSFYIPKPCHENWNKMTPQEQGRHCAVCEKVVVDFSKKSHAEITSVIANAAEGSVCGHFNVNQLDEKAQKQVFRNPRNLFNNNWKYFAMSVLGLFALNKKAAAQGGIKMRGAVAYRPETKTNSKAVMLAGVITNSEGKKLARAKVKIKSYEKEIANVETDADGFYSVKIAPGKIVNDKVTVMVQHYDYETKTVNDLPVNKEVVRLNVVMDEYMMVMGKIAYIPPVEEIKNPEKSEEIKELKEEINAVDTLLNKEIIKQSVLTNELNKTTTCDMNPAENKPNHVTVPEKTNTTIVEVTENKIIQATESSYKAPVQKITVKLNTQNAAIYPNPATTYAVVTCTKPDAYTLEIYNAIGGLQQTHAFTGDKFQFDLENLVPGTYLVRISTSEGILQTLKLIKD